MTAAAGPTPPPRTDRPSRRPRGAVVSLLAFAAALLLPAAAIGENNKCVSSLVLSPLFAALASLNGAI